MAQNDTYLLLVRLASPIFLLLGLSLSLRAQGMVGMGAPFRGVQSNFAENVGVQWGIRGGNGFAQNGPPLAPPAGAAGGLRFGGQQGGFRWGLGITASQGSSQSLGVQSPSITLPHGGMGFFTNTVQTPFVTGIVPVVGQQAVSPVRQRWRRLQYERLTRPVTNGASEPQDEDPPIQRRSATPRRPDDPPLLLQGSGEKRSP